MNQIAYHADGALSQFYTVTQFKWTALRYSNVQKNHQVLSLSMHTHARTPGLFHVTGVGITLLPAEQ